jgi:cation diffusion facilitator family transporter
METMTSFLIGLGVGIVGIGLAVRSLVGMHSNDPAVPGWVAFAVACVSIAAKEGLYRWNVATGRRFRSSAMIANAWHHRSDALSSLPVAVAVLGTRLMPAWKFLDHVAAVIVSVLIMKAAWEVAWPAFRELVDAGVERRERQQILTLVEDTPGVCQVHALRSRRIGPGWQVDLHVEVAEDLTVRQGHDIACAVRQRLLDEAPEVVDVLVHVEPDERPSRA